MTDTFTDDEQRGWVTFPTPNPSDPSKPNAFYGWFRLSRDGDLIARAVGSRLTLNFGKPEGVTFVVDTSKKFKSTR